MSKSKKVLLTLFVLEAIFIMFSVHYAMKHPHVFETPKQKYSSIIRLLNGNGQFVCSGTVVNAHTIITAAHCLAGATPFGMLPMPTFDVRPSNNKPLQVLGYLAGYSGQADQAVLMGDFKAFDTRKVITEPGDVIKLFKRGKGLMTCGYPYGGQLFCLPIQNPKQLLFQFRASSYLYPGMSGGPVVDQETGDIIAINTAVFEYEDEHETYVILSPTTEIFANTNTLELSM